MTQYLVRKTTHTTGEIFLDVTRSKENEEFVVVDAENKEEAKEKVKKPIITETNNSTVVSFDRPSEDTMEILFGKDYKKGQ
ncbi:DUF1381 domain-containing protein [Staphylococcus ureilyticus]|uniref:DUF1381 domain-containing protein n=1 Tax=Staphylococcus ureilyticus TaxID=94138 RepID=UPI0028FEEE9F|nr:DUF1381 domain-containing protein [Staphylococcus ureilyticus]MDU0461945.1 DUF1381 domain-containing protein [Staphylococcus ureilyticus]